MLTISLTVVILAFNFQLTIINFIKTNDSITKNLIQNPISEEEEETGDNTSCQFLNTHQEFEFFTSIKLLIL